MLKIAVGHSELPNTLDAAAEVLSQCEESLQGEVPQSGLLFASTNYNYQAILDSIKAKYPGVALAGCSSFGEISNKLGVGMESMALMLFASEVPCSYSVMAKELANNEQKQSYESVKKALDGISAQPILCCVFADGLKSNISNVIAGLRQYFGSDGVLLAGGGACDDWKFQQVFQFQDTEIASNAASMLIFTEPLKSSVAVRHGRSPLPMTTKHKVTSAKDNTVYRIDDKTAFDFYKDVLGEHANYEAYSLLIYLDDPEKSPDNYLVRAPFNINKEVGSITFPGDVPENTYVGISQLSNQQKTLDAARECAKKAMQSFTGKKVEAAFVFSCALRKEILGTQTAKELDLIKGELPKDVPYFGYYTFGEIGPYNPGEPNNYYNETIVIALIGQ